MPAMTYTYEWYREMLQRLRDVGHTFRRFKDGVPESGVLLRHDIDYSPEAARRMAKIESEIGVTGTYFVLVTSAFYNPSEPTTRSVLTDINDLGHQVGLHFDSRAYFETQPDASSLQRRVREDQDILRCRVSELTDTVAFHNPSEWILGRQFEGINHTYEPPFFDEIAYRSDSLGRWQESPPFPDTIPRAMQLLVHPELWGEDHADPEHRIRDAQKEMVTRTDEVVKQYSRLDWSSTSLSW